jgi:hypothetical protein
LTGLDRFAGLTALAVFADFAGLEDVLALAGFLICFLILDGFGAFAVLVFRGLACFALFFFVGFCLGTVSPFCSRQSHDGHTGETRYPAIRHVPDLDSGLRRDDGAG